MKRQEARIAFQKGRKLPFQGFLLTYVLTVGSLAAVSYLWGKIGFDLLLVALGWPHVLLGLAFNLDKVRRADLRSQLLFGGLMLVTFVIAFGHSRIDITTFIYLYFVFHAFRDEIYIYHERHTDYRFRGRIFDARGIAVLIAAIALAGVINLVPRNTPLQSQFHYTLSVLAAVLTGLTLLRRPRRLFGNLPGLRYAIPAVFLAIGAMTGLKFLRMHGWNAPLFFSFLVIFHYFSWYVFSLEKMSARSRNTSRPAGDISFLMQWLNTRRGFITSLVVLNALSFAAAWSYQVLHVSNTLAYGFDMKYFLYLLVLHVSTSFVPKNSIRTSNIPEQTEWQPADPAPAEIFSVSDPITVESSST